MMQLLMHALDTCFCHQSLNTQSLKTEGHHAPNIVAIDDIKGYYYDNL